MTSGGGYPGFDSWAGILDQWRCRAVDRVPVKGERDVVRRCQLYAGHDDEGHAHGERVSTKPWRSVSHRWTDDGRRWVDEPIIRLRWCCLFSS